MILRYLLEKEFKQIFRNRFLPRIILVFPCMALLVFPLAANFEVRDIRLSVVDHDQGPYSGRLVRKIAASGYFKLSRPAADHRAALSRIESDESDMILEIPSGFERELVRDGVGRVSISANAVNGVKGGLGSAYLSGVISEFADEIRQELLPGAGGNAPASIETIPRLRFNPHLRYEFMMVPALMVMLLTMICGFLPALNIVSEKEKGTIEQINVTPVGKFTFVLSKLLPYWIIGLVVMSIGLLIARSVYGLIPLGSLGTIYLFACLYILTISGFGLTVSNHSNTMQQAMFVMFFFVMVFNLMSGLFTPITSMPEWAQATTRINPLSYFIDVMRRVYLKGSGLQDLVPQFFALCACAVVMNGWAVLSYRKTN